ncbi:hypothetical protein AB8O38_16365 [Saccharomonospora xinjiangensis]|uniref:hypothetical protein n=1 Tax=Saccharomonospora xinjiangensis TaxID=75294 RepID=UPI00350EFC04
MPGEFRPAFLASAWEWFIPERFWCQSGEGDEGVVVNRACDPDRWLSVVSADRPLVTQFDDVATAWPEIGSARPVRDVHIGQLPYSWVERTGCSRTCGANVVMAATSAAMEGAMVIKAADAMVGWMLVVWGRAKCRHIPTTRSRILPLRGR